jgi:hypothetical protein
MKKNIATMSLALMAMMSETNFGEIPKETPREYKPRQKSIYPKAQKGQFHYWFRADGTFLNEKQGERMRKEECVFKCFSINDKNAIKKFNSFMRSNQAE